jgi:hypothetical protein
MSQGKRRPDGSKRRTSQRTAARPAPEPAPLPVERGFVRKESGELRGSADSISQFVIMAFDKLSESALKEFDEQRSGVSFDRGFKCHGNAEASYNASYVFEIRGVTPEDPNFRTWLDDIEATEGIYFQSSADALPLTFAERIQTLAARAEKEIHEQLDAELLYPFTLGAFVRVTDFEMMIQFRFEQRPPRAFAGNMPNDPATS